MKMNAFVKELEGDTIATLASTFTDPKLLPDNFMSELEEDCKGFTKIIENIDKMPSAFPIPFIDLSQIADGGIAFEIEVSNSNGNAVEIPLQSLAQMMQGFSVVFNFQPSETEQTNQDQNAANTQQNNNNNGPNQSQ